MVEKINSYVTVLWEAKAKKGMESKMKTFITNAVTASRYEFGCIDYEAHEVEGQSGKFIILERWVSMEALQEHLNSPRVKEKGPELVEMMAGSIEDGIRFLHPFRPIQ
ncbi:antibiotic biosynthesis monooxygenase [Flavobacterium jejuense]|uniref:Antibiotic biosynthesis monooxygenase n=1 Tax=Flavobacterium jejuense TaxID=1544455 RepID=A0ABX0IPY8_9FLAO|nr:antibiotic biosynthesis monooxygenase [Flavobacterium jejuense]NHN25261.1 antibiotic biosynthesis monooxygenase [Flavobacterium jejuense]